VVNFWKLGKGHDKNLDIGYLTVAYLVPPNKGIDRCRSIIFPAAAGQLRNSNSLLSDGGAGYFVSGWCFPRHGL
jgi:hypothetical protein